MRNAEPIAFHLNGSGTEAAEMTTTQPTSKETA